MDSSSNHENSSFWKTGTKNVPGRPSPKTTSIKSTKNSVGTSFQDYQLSVSDAWDTGDDEFCIISGIADTKISKRVSQTTAMNVIETHRSNILHKSKENTTATAPVNIKATRQLSLGEDNVACSNDNDLNKTSNFSSKVLSSSIENTSTSENLNRPKFRQIHAYPGRPQPQKFTSNSEDSEYETKIEKFSTILENQLLDLIALKQLSWSGIPRKMRAVTWRILSKYLPPSLERRSSVLESKRQNYHDLRLKYFKVDSQDESQQDTYRQIHIDVPRMNPHISIFQQELVQQMFERILFIWAIRHPASGYVQGINDLVTPFFIVFLQEILGPERDLETFNLNELSVDIRDNIEADSFWCLSKFLDCIQDNYIFAQLGIQEKVNQLKDLIQRIDGTLHKHLQNHGVDYLQFSFRWMNNLLTRELPLHCTIRLWDTYLAESDGFALFHLYVCAAFLLHWRDQLLQQNDFQGLMLLLQNLPTHNWGNKHINVLVAEAFRLKFTYADAPKHLEGKS
ncbi:TBC1 domain family member 22B [Condylostylus longicornis]|uniref:TBC1 domain family member 22B n=1 Tax=Condylostylus longicornis TaxID=2530218 RepID=UPI00244DB8F7|nr:TBC1 domain family member 22B [Condylostylus longicornis]